MAVSKSDVIARFVEFSTVSDAEFTAVLADATLLTNSGVWGARTDLATIYRAAHLLACAHPDLVPPGEGPVSSETYGRTSVAYAVAAAPVVEKLESTRYGRLLAQLQATNVMSRFLPGVCAS